MSRMELALLGGSLRTGSVSEQVLHVCAELAGKHGAQTTVLVADELVLAPYAPDSAVRQAAARALLSALRRADGVIIATPTYHGGASGLVKNALDYVEDLAGDTPAYLSDRAVGTVAVGWSEHGAAIAVADLRNTIMCLRGWVTPMAVTINSAQIPLGADPVRSDQRTMRRLEVLVGQVVDFTRQARSDRWSTSA
jgi:FMN reductase